MLVKITGDPAATADIMGSGTYENIRGKVDFYDTYGGTVMVVELYGLPEELEDKGSGFYGFHIHEGASCTGNAEDALADTGMHYDEEGRAHPEHTGDLPPLLSNGGVIWTAIYTGRFYPEDVIGRTIVLHEGADDFRSQPSGDSGAKIACGEIVAWDNGNLTSRQQ